MILLHDPSKHRQNSRIEDGSKQTNCLSQSAVLASWVFLLSAAGLHVPTVSCTMSDWLSSGIPRSENINIRWWWLWNILKNHIQEHLESGWYTWIWMYLNIQKSFEILWKLKCFKTWNEITEAVMDEYILEYWSNNLKACAVC